MVLAAFGGTDPAEAAADVNLELTVADLGSIAGGADKAVKRAKAGVKDAALEADTLVRAQDLLDAGTPLRAATWEPEAEKVLRNFSPLTLKPVLAVVNLGEDQVGEAAERAAAVERALGLPAAPRWRRRRPGSTRRTRPSS